MPLPADADVPIDPEVEREMTVRPFVIPTFSPHIKAEDVKDFNQRDQKMLLALSLVEQKQDFTLDAHLITNRQLRYVESELIRLRKSQGKINVQSAVLTWIGVTVGAGVIAALLKRVVDAF